MATLPDVFQAMAPLLAQISQYNGQELPDTYHNKVMQAISYGINLAVAKHLKDAGADYLVMGSHLLEGDIDENIKVLRQTLGI